MKKKKTILGIALMLLVVLLVLQGCTTANNTAATEAPTATEAPAATDAPMATDAPAATETPTADTGEKLFTLEELAQFDGSNGNPAYIAVDGVVYDVTNVPQWNGGNHNGFTAGQELTEEIKTISPHGIAKLTGVPVVGKLAE